MDRGVVAVVAILLMVSASVPANAESGEGDESESRTPKQRAQAAFERGVALYEQGEYARAVVKFRKGYHIVPNPIFLYNLASAQTRLGNYSDAIDTTTEALSDEKLRGKTRVKTQALDRASRIMFRATRIAPKFKESPRADASDEPSPSRGGTSRDRSADRGERSGGGQSGIGALGWAGIAGVGAGTGGVLGSVLVSNAVSRDIDRLNELSDKPGAEDEFEAKKSEIQSKQLTGKILLFTGAGLGVVGGTLFTVDLLTGSSGGKANASVGLRANGTVTFSTAW